MKVVCRAMSKRAPDYHPVALYQEDWREAYGSSHIRHRKRGSVFPALANSSSLFGVDDEAKGLADMAGSAISRYWSSIFRLCIPTD